MTGDKRKGDRRKFRSTLKIIICDSVISWSSSSPYKNSLGESKTPPCRLTNDNDSHSKINISENSNDAVLSVVLLLITD